MDCLETFVVTEPWVAVPSFDEARDTIKPGRRFWLTIGVKLFRGFSREGRDEAGVLKSVPDMEVWIPVVVDVMLDRAPA